MQNLRRILASEGLIRTATPESGYFDDVYAAIERGRWDSAEGELRRLEQDLAYVDPRKRRKLERLWKDLQEYIAESRRG